MPLVMKTYPDWCELTILEPNKLFKDASLGNIVSSRELIHALEQMTCEPCLLAKLLCLLDECGFVFTQH